MLFIACLSLVADDTHLHSFALDQWSEVSEKATASVNVRAVILSLSKHSLALIVITNLYEKTYFPASFTC
jgi:hypothetical protein